MSRHPLSTNSIKLPLSWTAGLLLMLWACRGYGSPPELMLAHVYQRGIDLHAYWVSEKLDGVRAYWDGKRLISRGGNRIQAPPWFTVGFPSRPLDGELWMGHNRFDRVSGTVRREKPEDQSWRQIRFMVFDLPTHPGPFGARLEQLQRLIPGAQAPYIRLVEQFRVRNHRELMEKLDEVVEKGGEGLILHRDDAPYRAGRTGDLLKVKPYLDAEARVVAHLPGKGKYTDMLGSVLVEDPDGRRFRIGSGFSDAQRRDPPPVGSTITYTYHGRTKNGIPRFASFLRVREPL